MSECKERSLLYGVGINDAPPEWRVSGCPFYPKWRSMLQRGYDPRYPTHGDVTVCDEWKYFWTFKQWMEKQDWEGKALDKDILIHGNKIYSPDACLFVTHHINNLKLIDPLEYSGDYAQGVQLNQAEPRKTMPDGYWARLIRYGEREYLGTFSTVEEASAVYCKAKAAYIREIAEQQEPTLKIALLRWVDIYLTGGIQ